MNVLMETIIEELLRRRILVERNDKIRFSNNRDTKERFKEEHPEMFRVLSCYLYINYPQRERYKNFGGVMSMVKKKWQTMFYDPEPTAGGWYSGDIVTAETKEEAVKKAEKMYGSSKVDAQQISR